MKSPTSLWLSIITTVAITACGTFKSEKSEQSKEKPRSDAPTLVGRIASIPADKRFVLIQNYGNWNFDIGTILTTRGPEERTANLLITGESLGHFAAADLQSGLVEVGDAVYSKHAVKAIPQPAAPEAIAELPQNQQSFTPENVQKNN